MLKISCLLHNISSAPVVMVSVPATYYSTVTTSALPLFGLKQYNIQQYNYICSDGLLCSKHQLQKTLNGSQVTLLIQSITLNYQFVIYTKLFPYFSCCQFK